ncbi:methyl-accepting chemotaxis protein [Robertmurraya andreesenii]|uniref:Methyl-accepting chemotaxis protein n=1 Tax=Anoxybacillus andreesenii TaxID=1325932 RepID=A0ABT9V3C0_9BACL|nr:methyl-accepting chemotaxis protein [Robertmurraya andreesenii]MDQ0155440.1 methyl-accepting chemotaxis protein [Robertmurraya andreesenii]
MNMTVRKKILLSFFSIILLLAIVTGITYFQFEKIDNRYALLLEGSTEKIKLTNDLVLSNSDEIMYIQNYLISGDENSLNSFNTTREHFQNTIETLRTLTTDEEVGMTLIDNIMAAEVEYSAIASKMIEYKKLDYSERYIHAMEKEGQPAKEKLTALANELLNYQQKNLNAISKELSKQTKLIMVTVLIISIIAVLMGVAIALTLSKSISGPVQLISKGAEEITKGNLMIEAIKVKSRDEIGKLATSFNEMAETLREIIHEVNLTSEQVASSSEELMASSEQTTSATNQVVQSIQEVSNTIEIQGRNTEESVNAIAEITIGVQRIADSTGTVAESASETTKQATIGNEYIHKVVGQMDEIYRSTTDTNSMMKALESRTNEIGVIISVITDIADQTNLLALNAAIESARAGEHGKGFAVVADEVRKLAEQSRKSANQIGEIIQLIQKDTGKAAEITNDGNEIAKNGLILAEETRRTFDQILRSIEGVNSQTQELSAISEEMSASIEQVHTLIEEVAQLARISSNNTSEIASASQEQLATLEEVTASATALAERAEILRGLISKFRLRD